MTRIEILQIQNLGKNIKDANFDEIPRFEQGNLRVWDQYSTTALFLSLSRTAKKLLIINVAHIFVKRL